VDHVARDVVAGVFLAVAERAREGLVAGDQADDADDSRRQEPPSRKPVKKSRGRASVPSWDEIMFGGSNQD
jgi:hypothetical protein